MTSGLKYKTEMSEQQSSRKIYNGNPGRPDRPPGRSRAGQGRASPQHFIKKIIDFYF